MFIGWDLSWNTLENMPYASNGSRNNGMFTYKKSQVLRDLLGTSEKQNRTFLYNRSKLSSLLFDQDFSLLYLVLIHTVH